MKMLFFQLEKNKHENTRGIKMTEIEIVPYSTRRTESFKAAITEMGIAVYGEEEKERAFIEFDDGIAPLTFSLDAKNASIIEQEGKVKDFYDLGRFAQALRKHGYKLFVDRDNKTMRTEPPIVGMITEWTCKPPIKSVGTDGREFLNYNFDLKEVNKTPATPSKPRSPPAAIDSALVELWKEHLIEILQSSPFNEGGILSEINKRIPDTKTRQPLNAVRKKVLELLVKEKFLDLDEDARYSLRA